MTIATDMNHKNLEGEESLRKLFPSRKSLPPVPNLKFGKQFFKFLFFKICKKIVFQILSLRQEAGSLWREIIVVNFLPPRPSFYGPISILYVMFHEKTPISGEYSLSQNSRLNLVLFISHKCRDHFEWFWYQNEELLMENRRI